MGGANLSETKLNETLVADKNGQALLLDKDKPANNLPDTGNGCHGADLGLFPESVKGGMTPSRCTSFMRRSRCTSFMKRSRCRLFMRRLSIDRL